MTASFELEDCDENVRPCSKKSSNGINHKSMIPATSLCVGCGAAITDKFILRVQPDMEWHARCLRCVKCDRGLHDNNTCFVKDGKTYCREDYQRLFLQECAACHRGLHKTDYVVHVAATRTYHLSCLKCVACNRTLQTGDEFAIRPHGLLCLQDYQRDTISSSLEEDHNNNSIEKPLPLTNMLSTNSNNNNTDLPLSPLSNNKQPTGIKLEPLTNPTTLSNISNKSSILDNDSIDIVLRKSNGNCCRSYLDSISDERLQLGDNSANSGSMNIPPATNLSRATSRLSYVKGMMDDSSMNSDLDDASQDGSSLCGNQSLTGGHGGAGSLPSTGSGVGMKMGSNNNGGLGTNGGGSSSGCGGGGGGGGKRTSKEQKTTRVRTVLNEKQLHTLRTCYAANPRPDALMKEQLVEMTGLSPRVIRVWFQNKRCKDKKRQIMVKQMDQHQQVGGLDCPLQGVPLVAGSPLRNDGGMGGPGGANPLEIQQIPGPWTSANEHHQHHNSIIGCTTSSSSATIQSSSDNNSSTPAFQQLISAYHHHLSRPPPPPSANHMHPHSHTHPHSHPHPNLSILSAMGLISPHPTTGNNQTPSSSVRTLELDDSPPDSFGNKLIPYTVE